ncbi:MAG: Fe-S cluster assembly ATPase SufC [Sinobacteraceae bacterium]|nr:Fe-S cluster assembly ATPase SufC [Nevskiaceae bacterium]
MLEIKNLHAAVAGNPVLKGVDLQINAGEVHAIMGPNGAGKSTLANVLCGRDGYAASSGDARFDGEDVFALSPEERACRGMFMGFQYPVEIPGVSNMTLLKAALNARRQREGEAEMPAPEILKWVRQCAKEVDIDPKMLSRGVNEGFSGGEKKRNEILQMLVLQPRLMILDETDSGLDIDALKVVAHGINTLRGPDRATVLVTHYQRLLDHVKPDFVHVLADGRIVKSGGPELALELEERGYGWLEEAA